MGNTISRIHELPIKELKRWAGFFKTTIHPVTETGLLPKEIWKKNKTTLWYYEPTIKKYQTPLFLVYSLVNQPFILDLCKGNSFIQTLIDSGYEVYLLDFGIPGYEDKDLTFNDYITKYLSKGVQRALSHSGAEEISIMGFCLGGTLAAMYTSIAKEPIKNLILASTPIDFQYVPNYSNWKKPLTEKQTNFDEILDSVGLISPLFIYYGIRLITSPVYYSPYLSLLNHAYDAQYQIKWSRMNEWTKGHIPMPGTVLKQLFNDLIKENKLKNGGMIIEGEEVSLKNIKANLLVIGSQNDKLVPKEQIMPIMDLVSSEDKTFQLLHKGHVSLPENGQIPSYLSNWLSLRSNPIN
ncbi:alpha/beta fold hydrolase [Heyndrickxia sp. NPDC080065]|uniref:alpha/beta fold hydrolase n=1 Tax=Heyndrickxia sp. NPDC080065 TaxID=3390568 RepID=UPI003CFD3443